VAAEHLAAPPAVKADHEVAAMGSVARNNRFAGHRHLGGCAEPREGLVYGGDQVWEIACGDAVAREVAANNLGNETRVDYLAFRHSFPHPAILFSSSTARIVRGFKVLIGLNFKFRMGVRM
jgi:hypothetical protein